MYAGGWTLRAAAAMSGIHRNDAVEALYPLLATDSDGENLDCNADGSLTVYMQKDSTSPVRYSCRTSVLFASSHLPGALDVRRAPGHLGGGPGSALRRQVDQPHNRSGGGMFTFRLAGASKLT